MSEVDVFWYHTLQLCLKITCGEHVEFNFRLYSFSTYRAHLDYRVVEHTRAKVNFKIECLLYHGLKVL